MDRLTVRNVSELRRPWEAGDRDSSLASLLFFSGLKLFPSAIT